MGRARSRTNATSATGASRRPDAFATVLGDSRGRGKDRRSEQLPLTTDTRVEFVQVGDADAELMAVYVNGELTYFGERDAYLYENNGWADYDLSAQVSLPGDADRPDPPLEGAGLEVEFYVGLNEENIPLVMGPRLFWHGRALGDCDGSDYPPAAALTALGASATVYQLPPEEHAYWYSIPNGDAELTAQPPQSIYAADRQRWQAAQTQ